MIIDFQVHTRINSDGKSITYLFTLSSSFTGSSGGNRLKVIDLYRIKFYESNVFSFYDIVDLMHVNVKINTAFITHKRVF